MHAESGVLSWSTDFLAFASRQCVPNIVDLSVRFTLYSNFAALFLLRAAEAAREAKSLVYTGM